MPVCALWCSQWVLQQERGRMEIITACKWHNYGPEDSRGSERKHNKNITGGFFGSLKLILKPTVFYTKAKVKIKRSHV